MDDQYLQIELIKAVGNIAKAFDRIADAIENRTEKEFPSPLEKMINLARYSELCKALDLGDKSPETTQDVIESAMTKRAEQIISIKKLKCKHCVFVKNVKSLPAFCAAGKRDVFGDEPACVEINPTQETIDTIGEIKLNQDGEVIE
jgi:hypothetical protein